MTSMWSETKPIGISTTPRHAVGRRAPRRWSLTSGSSHGVAAHRSASSRRGRGGGRDRSPRAPARPPRRRRCGAGGRRRRALAGGLGPLVSAIAVGIECVTKTRRARSPPSSGSSASAARRGVDDRLDEAGVVVVLPQLVQSRGTLDLARRRRRGSRGTAGTTSRTSSADVAKTAARLHPVGAHLRQRVGEVGVPVAVAPVDRQVDPLLGEVLLDRRDQRTVLVVDRALPPKRK